MIVSLNGELLPVERAQVSAFDRGFILGDGVYEAFRAFRGVPIAIGRHIERLAESLEAIDIPFDASRLVGMTHDLLEANRLDNAFVYWQVTRGVPGPGQPLRSRIPMGEMEPTVFGYASVQPALESFREVPTCSASIVEDRRWLRARLKSISLAGNVITAMRARDNGAQEAVMVRDGLVTEACASNVLLAVREGSHTRLVTPSLESVPILAGITRARILELDPSIVERPVSEREIAEAAEVIMVGTTSLVTAVTHLDDRPVGDGAPGAHARRLFGLLMDATRAEIDAAVACGRVA